MTTQNDGNKLAPGNPGCRLCGAPLADQFLDLGLSPLCQTQVPFGREGTPEVFYPLVTWVCGECSLVQAQDFVAADGIFTENYPYFSSFSTSWVEHARRHVHSMVKRLSLGEGSFVVEVASNDGYLLQHVRALGIRCLGIEPSGSVANAALEKGIPTLVEFLGRESGARIAAQNGKADLVIGNNVLAHVPDLNDFIGGLRELIAPHGVITMEIPHVMQLVLQNQFDTIYHEHFCYYSLGALQTAFARSGLQVFDVEELPTHGGSLRVFVQHLASGAHAVSGRVPELLKREEEGGYLRGGTAFRGFAERVHRAKRDVLGFLLKAQAEGKRVAGFGAPGKGNTFLNYCGIKTDLVQFTVDSNPHKQLHYTPGSRIPILPPSALREHRPDFVLILPWNLRTEITEAHAYIREWGGRFVVAIPALEIIG